MSELAKKRCVPCEGGVPPLKGKEIEEKLRELDSSWQVVEEHHLKRTFRFPDFMSALKFVNQVGEVAEAEGHHPDIYLTWGKVEISLYTHSIGGLSENDFILAAKIDELLKRTQG
jgi:4a-hydroxytetrahydrobiopterin dehydratase